jgi:4-amino-4-deoxy-L-arabinose transferase-like glycosyltransferase
MDVSPATEAMSASRHTLGSTLGSKPGTQAGSLIEPSDAPTWAWFALLFFAVAMYALGLDGQYIPNNGDELVYAHIARLTAQSGHWLPLASELDNMRNTKPPGLFWQAIIASGWGQHWQMWVLRLPSLLYTLLITGAIAWSIHRITHNPRRALIAACVYLGFFCTFRYGRPFLTSAPETFWLDLPLFALLWYRPHPMHATPPVTEKYKEKEPVARIIRAHSATKTIANSLLIVVSMGVAWGLGAAYKSFALIAPAAAALWCAVLASEPTLSWRKVAQTSLQIGAGAVLALGIFALWFALDPDPAAVWREFVVGENAGKMVDKQGYWHEALHGGDSSLWAQVLAYVQNAGLLAFVVLGLAWVGLRHLGGSSRSAHLYILLAWLAVWLVVFSIPSQRSARYVIPAMPAVAMLIALYWERIARGWFLLSLVLTAAALLTLGRIAWVVHGLNIGSDAELGLAMAAVLVGTVAVVAGVLKPQWTRACTVAASLVVYACFNFTVMPLDGPGGRYAPNVPHAPHLRIAVPSDFNAQFERFQFLLPGHQFVPYDVGILTDNKTVLPRLTEFLASFDAVIWGPANATEQAPACLPNCTVIATRWIVKGRHKPGEINLDNLWYPQTWLLSREWLVVRGTAP